MLRRISKRIRKRAAKTLAMVATLGCPLTTSAMESVTIDYNGKKLFEVQYYGVNDSNKNTQEIFYNPGAPFAKILTWTANDYIKNAANKAFNWWAEILGPGASIKQPVQYFVGTNDIKNAGANSYSFLNGQRTEKPDLFKEIIQNGRVVEYFNDLNDLVSRGENASEMAFAKIIIGQNIGLNKGDGNYGWINPDYYAAPFPLVMKRIDLTTTIFHENGHALGIETDRRKAYVNYNNTNGIYYFGDGADNTHNFTSHIRDMYGKAATNGMYIFTNEMLNDEDFMKQMYEKTGQNFTADNSFVMDDVKGTERNGKVYAYFVGDNVAEVLDGKTFTRGDGEQISGIPLNMWEGAPELGHLELARSLMSHQQYRSYNNFMEAELAVLQDIGYTIDRKNFYGRSIYNDNQKIINDQIFSARENGKYVNGYNSSTFGVGLHIYGSKNDVTQRGNIFTNGAGAVGVRVDGIENKVTIDKDTEIHADGSLNSGILVAYGKNHDITIDGLVTATGDEGDAVHFEFGANMLGSTTEYRGSYLRYEGNVDVDGNLAYLKNPDLNDIDGDDYSFTDLKNGDLNAPMGSLTVNGKLQSESGAAIYIGEEAFVDKIDINPGAIIIGDIKSNWKHFDLEKDGIYDTKGTTTYRTYKTDSSGNPTLDENGNCIYETKTGEIEPLYIQYNGGKYVYNEYIPDLVTQLNFNDTVDAIHTDDATLSYDGDITGSDNIKLNINHAGVLYTGTADVVNVTVLEESGLLGGTYTVNDMSSKMAAGFSDDTTGKFINHGQIGHMTINGDLISDGILTRFIVPFNDKEMITVNGNANIDGSEFYAKILPGDSTTILTAKKVTGTLANDTDFYKSSLVKQIGRTTDTSVIVTAERKEMQGLNSPTQSKSLAAIDNMNSNLIGDSRREELFSIYYNDDATTRKALSQIGESSAPNLMSHTQQSDLANRIIGDRFNSRNYGNDFWVKFSKKLYDGEKFHGQAISGGWDKSFNNNWRGGVFISYDASNLDNGNTYDTRAGIYSGFNSGPNSAFFYVDAGQVRNKLSRNMSALNLSSHAKYKGTIFEIGGEYKRNLTQNNNYSISPFIGMQLSRMNQNSFSEEGAGIYNQHVHSLSNTYLAGQCGLEYRKDFSRGNIAARIGLRHAFSGAEPKLRYTFEGGNQSYSLRNKQDKTHFIFGLTGENEIAKDLRLSGDIFLIKGSHDRTLSASMMLQKSF